jgi:hypothetical protein
MISGAQKAGTTSLFKYLVQHPQIVTHPHKEMGFFSHDLEYCQGYAKVFQKYFPEAEEEGGGVIAKDVMILPSHTALERLYDHNPKMHIVVLLRNPVRRAYSAYWFARSRGWESMPTFEMALEAEPIRLAEDRYKWRYCTYLDTSTYFQHIERCYKRFGQEHVHVYLTEDLYEAPQSICENLFRILAVDAAFRPDVSRQHNKAIKARLDILAKACSGLVGSSHPAKMFVKRFVPTSMIYKVKHVILSLNAKEFRPPPMAEETRQRLIGYFQPHNLRLSEMLGRDLALWNQ